MMIVWGNLKGTNCFKDRWEDSIKMCVKDLWWEGLDWMCFAQCNEKWWNVMSKIMNNTWEILD
jgi:hypothetical protein